MGIFLRRSHFFFIIEKKINKSPPQIMLVCGNLTLVWTKELIVVQVWNKILI